MVKEFLKNLFNRNKKKSSYLNELINAVIDGNIVKVNYLIEKKKINLESKDILGRTALIHLILIRNALTYYFLHHKWIKNDAKIRIIQIYDTIFHRLIEVNQRLEHINMKTGEGKTALIYASMLGLYDYVDYLLLHGADANIEGNDNKTALMHAENKMIYDRLEPVTWNKAPPIPEFIYITLCNNNNIQNLLPSYEESLDNK